MALTADPKPTQAQENGKAKANAGATIDIRRPADGGVMASVPISSPAEVGATVARLRGAQAEWEGIGFDDRRRWLAAFRDWLLANNDRLADILQAETGKVRAEAEYELPSVAGTVNYYGKNGARFLADETPRASFPLMKSKKLRIVRRPYQVVGVIGPWNLPLLLPLGDAVPALLAGCAVVLKPSELTPLALMEVVRGWREELGAPDVLDLVNGAADTGAAVVDECDFVQFTGSGRTGKVVMKRAAETLTPVSLELGGKDPMIVLGDADLDRAVNAAAWGGLANSGQVCMAVERVYVEEPVYDQFVSKLVERVRTLELGIDGRSYESDIGAITFPKQMSIVEDHVADARKNGARILTGGKRTDGSGDFYEPTVIADADHTMKVMGDETFGPVIPVMKVADADEAVRLANDTRYGLSASVFTSSIDHGVEIARRVDAGAVNVNDVYTNVFISDLPLGGWNESGIGSRNGPGGIRKYCRTAAIVTSRIKQAKAEPLWFPYGAAQRKVAARLFGFLVARGWRRRLAAARLGSRPRG